jgi:NADH dehydrogenase (ubiquinone) Fe-S protein 3
MGNVLILWGYSLVRILPKYIISVVFANGELTLNVNYKNISKVLFFIKNHTNSQYKILMDISAMDFTNKAFRFELVYNLLSIKFNSRVKLKTCVNETDVVETASGLYFSAGWSEREVWDMFGIFFSGHLDLRRILTDYGFEGHPLRKDFPLSGFVSVRYDELHKVVTCESLEHSQEFRFFDLETPWVLKK